MQGLSAKGRGVQWGDARPLPSLVAHGLLRAPPLRRNARPRLRRPLERWVRRLQRAQGLGHEVAQPGAMRQRRAQEPVELVVGQLEHAEEQIRGGRLPSRRGRVRAGGAPVPREGRACQAARHDAQALAPCGGAEARVLRPGPAGDGRPSGRKRRRRVPSQSVRHGGQQPTVRGMRPPRRLPRFLLRSSPCCRQAGRCPAVLPLSASIHRVVCSQLPLDRFVLQHPMCAALHGEGHVPAVPRKLLCHPREVVPALHAVDLDDVIVRKYAAWKLAALVPQVHAASF
mmetsp:Transcript_103780/g.289003  ORF Transcript_103780/g.289003 Transcript_103780/m.289003 type:complete len:285 (-) Transcript_103780:1296-2150(-)